jgi:competence/damage-inducible protein CinA C-terminal domain
MKRTVNRLLNFFEEKGLTISLAESVTCGLAAHQLNIAKGTSEVLMGSIVCYNEKVKTGLLGIKPGLIKKHSAESLMVTNEMAKSLSKLFKSDVYAAVTGLASPGASEDNNKPVGTIFFSVKYNSKIWSLKKKFNGSPLEIKRKACEQLYAFLYSKIKSVV